MIDSIKNRYTFSLVIVLIPLLVSFSLVTVKTYTNHIDKDLSNMLSKVMEQSQVSLQNAIWDLDTDYINDFADSLLLNEEVIYLSITSQSNFFPDGGKIATRIRPQFAKKDLGFFNNSNRFITSKRKISYKNIDIGSIEIVLSREEIIHAYRISTLIICLLIFLFTVSIFLVTMFVSRIYIFKPLGELKNVANEIQNGNLDVEIVTSRNDEIGRLATNIDHMRNSIKESIDKIRKTDELTEANLQLELALREIKTLRGIIPICSHCKHIRDDKGAWNQVEAYVSKHTEAKFSHGICPECTKKHYSKFSKPEE